MAGMQTARSLEGEQGILASGWPCDCSFSLEGRRAVFLSVHGGEMEADFATGAPIQTGVTLCYVLPITQGGELERLINEWLYMPNPHLLRMHI